MSTTIKVYEQGNGFPKEGDLLLANDGSVFRYVESDGRIHTGPAAGNFIYVSAVEADLDGEEEPFPARVEIEVSR